MRPTVDDPPIALAGWSVGGSGMLTARAQAVLARATTILVSGELDGFDPSDGRTRRAPVDAKVVASELAELGRRDERAVLLCDGDPLASKQGRAVGRWLTGLGAPWEYVPASALAVSSPAAVARISRAAIGTSDDRWSAWRRRFPLLGLVVAVTRAEAQSEPLVAALARLGAEPIVCPTIEIAAPEDMRPLDDALERAGAYDWAVFTSANGVDRFFGRMREIGGDVRDLKGVKLAAIGPATAAAIEARGLRVDLVPEAYVAESLVDALGASGRLDGTRVLLARAAVARDVLPDSLRAAGASVDVVEAYRTARPEGSAELLTLLVDSGGLDLATFTSSSTVTNFVALVGAARAHGIRAACIGPVTAATARDAGMTVAVEATEFTVTGLVDAIVRHRSNPN